MKSKLLQNTKAGIYLRLSNDDERAGESLSIENQRRILEKYVAEQGFELVDTYIDDGVSGTHFNRPGIQRLLEDAKMGRVNVIIVKDLSRFGRNYIEVGQYTDYIFPMYNIRFVALGDNVDTANSESSGMDMMPIMNVFNEWHAANTSKKIRAVIESNVMLPTAMLKVQTKRSCLSVTSLRQVMCSVCSRCVPKALAPTRLRKPLMTSTSRSHPITRNRNSVFRTLGVPIIFGRAVR